MDLIEWLRLHGYHDIRLLELNRCYIRLWVDGNIVEVRRRGKALSVRAYRINHYLARLILEFISIKKA